MNKEYDKAIRRMIPFAIFILVLVLSLNYLYLHYSLQNTISHRKMQFYMSIPVTQQINSVFLGTSHTADDINPDFLPLSYNMAFFGWGYYNYYLLFKNMVDRDLPIRNIVLEVDINSFASTYNLQSADEVLIYNPSLSLVETSSILNESYVKVWIKRYLPFIGQGYVLLDCGLHHLTPIESNGFIAKDGKIDPAATKGAAAGRYGFYNSIDISNVQLEYFTEIISLAAKSNITVVLISLPAIKEMNQMLELHNLSRDRLVEKIIILADENAQGGKFYYLDYHDFLSDKPEYFWDADHLNRDGAAILTKRMHHDFVALGLS